MIVNLMLRTYAVSTKLGLRKKFIKDDKHKPPDSIYKLVRKRKDVFFFFFVYFFLFVCLCLFLCSFLCLFFFADMILFAFLFDLFDP